jgi:hypothetical protein
VPRLYRILFWLVVCVAGFAGGISAETADDAAAVAVVFPPWWPDARVFAAAAAAGDIVNRGTVPFVLIVQSERPGLGARLRAAGALLVLNPLAAGGCSPPSTGGNNV